MTECCGRKARWQHRMVWICYIKWLNIRTVVDGSEKLRPAEADEDGQGEVDDGEEENKRVDIAARSVTAPQTNSWHQQKARWFQKRYSLEVRKENKKLWNVCRGNWRISKRRRKNWRRRFSDHLMNWFEEISVSRPRPNTSNAWKITVKSWSGRMRASGSRNRRPLGFQWTVGVRRERPKEPRCLWKALMTNTSELNLKWNKCSGHGM